MHDGITQRKYELVLATSSSQFACYICVIVVSAYAIRNITYRLKSIESYCDKVAQSGLVHSDVDAIEVFGVSVAK